MSRIADAAARAGVEVQGKGVSAWEKELAAAAELLDSESSASAKASAFAGATADKPAGKPNPKPQIANPKSQIANPKVPSTTARDALSDFGGRLPTPSKIERAPATDEAGRQPESPPETIDFELTAAMRRIFLAPKSAALGNSVRSVLFCTVPGAHMSDVAWRAAEVVATQSGKRVAFVEDGTNDRVPSSGAGGLVTRIGWYAADTTAADVVAQEEPAAVVGEPTRRAPLHGAPPAPILGEHVPDLFGSFDFVIVSATAAAPDDLVPITHEVDGVIVVISENDSRRDAAEALVEALRMSGARLLGAVFANVKPATPDSLFRFSA